MRVTDGTPQSPSSLLHQVPSSVTSNDDDTTSRRLPPVLVGRRGRRDLGANEAKARDQSAPTESLRMLLL